MIWQRSDFCALQFLPSWSPALQVQESGFSLRGALWATSPPPAEVVVDMVSQMQSEDRSHFWNIKRKKEAQLHDFMLRSCSLNTGGCLKPGFCWPCIYIMNIRCPTSRFTDFAYIQLQYNIFQFFVSAEGDSFSFHFPHLILPAGSFKHSSQNPQTTRKSTTNQFPSMLSAVA